VLILFHSPKGGTGTTFLAAHCAMQFAERGYDTVAIDFTYQNALKLFFSLLPDQELVALEDTGRDAVIVSGVELLDGHHLGCKPSFREMLAEPGIKPFPDEKLIIADVASGDRELKNLLMPHAALHVCPIVPRPTALAALAKTDPDTPLIDLPKTAIVLNMLDDTRKLSRHTHIFIRSAFEQILCGTVREDESVAFAVANFERLATAFPESVALADVRAVTDAIEKRCFPALERSDAG
jgi:cellulose biosynthesis protein BcsQ